MARKASPGMTSFTGVWASEALPVLNTSSVRSSGMPPRRTSFSTATASGQSAVCTWAVGQVLVSYTVIFLVCHSAGDRAMWEASKSVWPSVM